MNKLDWYLDKKDGIEKIQPNNNLARKYLEKSKE